MVWLIAGLVIGVALCLLTVRPRLVEAAALRRERDGFAAEAHRLTGELESERTMAADRFKALSAEALRANNEQFLALAKQALGNYQTEARGELEKREKAVQQLVAPITESLSKVDQRLDRFDRERLQTTTVLQQQLLSAEAECAFAGRRVRGTMDHLENRAFVGKRRRRAFEADSRGGAIQQPTDRPPVANQARRRPQCAPAPLGGRKRFQRVASGHQARFGFPRAGSARERSDS